MPKYYFQGFESNPVESDVPLTPAEKAEAAQWKYGSSPPFLREEGIDKPKTPIRRAAELATKGVARGIEGLLSIPPGGAEYARPVSEAVAPWVVPQTEAEVLGMLVAGPAGKYGAKGLPQLPRLGALLGMTAGGAGAGAGGAALAGEPLGPESAAGSLRGGLGWLLGHLPGMTRRQMPGGPTAAGGEMAPKVGEVMGREVPELAGARTPQQLYEMGRGAGGHAPRIKEAIEDMYGEMLERLAQGSGGQKILVPSLLSEKDRTVVTLALTAQARTPGGPQAAQNLQTLRDRFGVTLEEVVGHLKARKAAFRSPSQSLTAQGQRASVPQIIREVEEDITQLGLPATLMRDYAETSQKYKVGKAFQEMLFPEKLYTPGRELLPESLQGRFAALTAGPKRPLAQRIGPAAHEELADVIGRGTPPGTRDVPGALTRLLHFVLGTRGAPMVYGSTGALRGPLFSQYAAGPGRLPLEASPMWKNLMAVLTQKRIPGETEAPAITGTQ